ncbi:unnamed protein product [Moneuplotes crassus]|uniref:Uncharacterized protein n=1 Tax=Euplotes crassus TaxID=5936 RepID=A0AAD1U2Y6_EUPCR|nr:unnamed protein product [Moneuplotes crassus]
MNRVFPTTGTSQPPWGWAREIIMNKEGGGIECGEGKRPVKVYDYGARERIEQVCGKEGRDRTINLSQTCNKVLFERASASLSKRGHNVSTSSVGKTNYSSGKGACNDSRSNYLDSSIRGYTQTTQYPPSREKKNDYRSFLESEKNMANDYHQISGGSQFEASFTSDESFSGIDTSYLRIQNISLLSHNDSLGQSQKDISNQKERLKANPDILNQPQSCQNKQTSAFIEFKKEKKEKCKRPDQRSPSEVGPDEANEGIELLVKNRQRMNSSVLRSNNYKKLSMSSYQEGQSTVSPVNFLCQRILPKDKRPQNKNNCGVESVLQPSQRRLENYQSFSQIKNSRNNPRPSLTRCASQRKCESQEIKVRNESEREAGKRVLSVCNSYKAGLDQVPKDIPRGPSARIPRNTGQIHAKSRSNCPHNRNRINRPLVSRCNSQVDSMNGTNRSVGSRQDSMSRKADFSKLKSKEIDDDVESESSFTSTESQVSLNVHRYDELISFRQDRQEIPECDQPHVEESMIKDSILNTEDCQSESSYKSVSSSDIDLEGIHQKYDTLKFRKNGYLWKRLNDLRTRFP